MQKLKFSKHLLQGDAVSLTQFYLGSNMLPFKAVAEETRYDVSTVRKWYKNNSWPLEKAGNALRLVSGNHEVTCMVLSGSTTIHIDPNDSLAGSLVLQEVAIVESEGDRAILDIDEYGGETGLHIPANETIVVKSLCINGKWFSGTLVIDQENLEEILEPDEDEDLDLSKADEAIWNASKKFINISLEDKCWTATPDSHSNFKTILDLLIDGNNAEAIKLISVKAAIKEFTKGHIKIVGNDLTYKDISIQSGLSDRIIKMYQENQDISSLVAFLEKVMENPTRKTVYRLFDFLKANDIEITKDGHFEAWKVIRSNFTDCYTGTIDNSPGKIVEMDRFLVQDDDNITCSHGLHVCSRSYIRHFSSSSDILVKVKVHPKDVVSIPTDYNDAKMRVCKYEVIGIAE